MGIFNIKSGTNETPPATQSFKKGIGHELVNTAFRQAPEKASCFTFPRPAVAPSATWP
jgi:hypothetical protein